MMPFLCEFKYDRNQLHAHTAPITDIHVSVRAGLLATASADGKIVLWDLNNLSYIRTLPNRESLPVSLVTISATLCDVASVHDPPAAGKTRVAMETTAKDKVDNDSDSYEKDETYKYESLIRVHTVNARFVGSVKIAERVTSICYSAAPEGISVNVIACGLHTGAVRLHSAWDLRHVAYIPPADNPHPLLSVTYSSDSSVLFGCYADGVVVAWESGAPSRPLPARILPAHALF
ncbi:lysosomal-trafficking regulator [Phthorimaea operculella]|nr:lysosomal-trafficking regulator [Phthorimaea operculella]